MGGQGKESDGRPEIQDKSLKRDSVLIIGGPTGSGKNDAALEIAAWIPSEIVNADSRQIYRELQIGTNQPGTAEKTRIPHHLFAFVAPNIGFSVADYERAAAPVIAQILQNRRLPIVVGGTGFYMKALLKGVWPVPPKDPELRSRLQRIKDRRGNARLHAVLQRLDPASAEKIPPNDSYRVARALEIYFQTGKRKSELQSPPNDRFAARKYFLDIDVEVLASRLRERNRLQFKAGWIEEVDALLGKYPDFPAFPAAASLGYPEIVSYLRGGISLEECRETVLRKTLQYAKRQRTWFRNQDGFERVTSVEELHKKVESVLQ